jgi:hypothetical protein
MIAAGIIPAFAALAIPSQIPFLTRALSVLLWELSVIPAINYLSRPAELRRPLPFIETISFIYGLYYAIPVVLNEVNRAWRASVDPSYGYDVPIQLALLGWAAMMATYFIASSVVGRRKRPRPVPWYPPLITKWACGFVIAGIIVNGGGFITGNNISVGGMIQFFVSLQWLGLGLLTVLLRRRELSRAGKITLFGGFLVISGITLAQGNVLPIVMLGVVVAFAVIVGRPHVEARWLIVGGFILICAVSFRGIMRDFRLTAWQGSIAFSQSEKFSLALTLMSNRIKTEGIIATIAGGGSQTAQRSATMDIFADVIRRTPDEVPYWKGETYKSLVGAFIPRFLWPDKPVKGLGQAFGHRYRYLDPTNLSTAINLPILVEFYANFGSDAVVIGMLIVGLIYGTTASIVNRTGQSLILSMIGLTLLLPLLLIESDFSLVFGGLPLSGFALWGIYTMMVRSANKHAKRTSQARAQMASAYSTLPRSGDNRPALPAR